MTSEQRSITINSDKSLLDIPLIYDFIKKSYWGESRTLAQTQSSIDNSLCFGMYDQQKQIGFARVVTDYSVFAYLLDVFILPEYQHRGLGKLLISKILENESLKSITSWMLATRDAHDLYKKFGFHMLDEPKRVMYLKK